MTSDETAVKFDGDVSRGIHPKEKDGRMSFRVPLAGRVVVRNEKYDDAEEHTYVVELDGIEPTSCTCEDYEYRKKHSPDGCKHMAAVEAREPVVAAACGAYGTPEEYREETPAEPESAAVATDGGSPERDPSPIESAAVDELHARRGVGGERR